MKLNVKRFLKLLNPLPPVGGLEVSDSTLRFIVLPEERKPVTAALRLPPGIVEGGRVKNKTALTDALRELHQKVSGWKKPVHAVLSLPAHLVYIQSFDIPFLPEERLAEAARLNLQMLSPIDFEKAYASWQKVGERFSEGGQIELLGAFAERTVVEEFTSAVRGAGFVPVAIEFPSLALARVIAERVGAVPAESYLSIHIAPDGTSLAIHRSGNMHFNHFHSWASIQEEFGGKQLSNADFQSFMIRETQKVLNFYTGRWGGTVSGAIVVASGIGEQIGKLIETNFGLPVKQVALKNVPGLDPSWFVAFGAALRGRISRADDTFISLTDEPVQVQYREARIINFISLWRNIAATSLVFILIVFGATNLFVRTQEKRVTDRTPIGEAELAEVQRLAEAAKEFNQLVDGAFAAKSQEVRWSRFLDAIAAVATGRVSVGRISVVDTAVTIAGSAAGEALVLQFRDALARVPTFSEVMLPLEGIRQNQSGTVDFTLSFRLTAFEF